jgi:hypothetical protein
VRQDGDDDDNEEDDKEEEEEEEEEDKLMMMRTATACLHPSLTEAILMREAFLFMKAPARLGTFLIPGLPKYVRN